jgi:copper chaperone
LKYHVNPLTCGSCVRRITEALQAIDSGARVEVDLAAGTVVAEGFFNDATVIATLAAIGYEASPASSAEPANTDSPAGAGCCGTCHA